MTPDQINASVAEILLAEGVGWGFEYREVCTDKDGGCKHIISCHQCDAYGANFPADFCSDPAAAWKLYCHWFTRDTVAAKKWIADAIFIDPTALAEAFIASKEKKCQT